MRILLLIALALLFAPAAAEESRPVRSAGIWQCPSPAPGPGCRKVALEELRLAGPETHLVQPVTVDRAALLQGRPLMVSMVALASSEVRWNGVPIGRNGTPGPDAASERPGRLLATFAVPQRLVRPGRNIVSARLSAHHLWLPVRRAVHEFEIAPYETPLLPGLTHYLPALLTLGAFAAAMVYFGTGVALDRPDLKVLLPALIATLALLQLLAETARTFLAYAYPWHLARVSLIALLSAAISIAIAAYAAHRFAPDWRRRLSWGMAALAAASLLLIPWYDLKALAPIMAGFAAALACSVRGMRSAVPAARLGAAAAATAIVLMVWQATSFLDQAYYLALAAFLIALVAEQVFVLRHARRTGAEEAERAAGLEHRLREAGGRTPATVPLKDGARTHLVPESEILFCKAADDYSEVHLSSGRTILVTTTLSKLQQVLPDRFARVHKSYIVNKAHVTAVSPRPGGGRMLALAGGPSVPVGRSYAAALADQVQPPLPTRA